MYIKWWRNLSDLWRQAWCPHHWKRVEQPTVPLPGNFFSEWRCSLCGKRIVSATWKMSPDCNKRSIYPRKRFWGRVPQVLRAITPELICQAALLAATKEADAS